MYISKFLSTLGPQSQITKLKETRNHLQNIEKITAVVDKTCV